MYKYRILVVDDEQDLCNIVAVNLELAGYDVDFALSAEEAMRCDLASYSLFLLDVMMPNMTGFDLAQILKKDDNTSHIPIIFLTAKDSEEDMLNGFSLGADDYIDKPFSVKELVARVKAVINRSVTKRADLKELQQASQNKPANIDIYIDREGKQISIDGVYVLFTPTEFNLLSLLLDNRGRVFSRSDLVRLVWPKDVIVTDRTVDVNINRIRKKIGRYSNNIVTRQGFGYCFE